MVHLVQCSTRFAGPVSSAFFLYTHRLQNSKWKWISPLSFIFIKPATIIILIVYRYICIFLRWSKWTDIRRRYWSYSKIKTADSPIFDLKRKGKKKWKKNKLNLINASLSLYSYLRCTYSFLKIPTDTFLTHHRALCNPFADLFLSMGNIKHCY